MSSDFILKRPPAPAINRPPIVKLRPSLTIICCLVGRAITSLTSLN